MPQTAAVAMAAIAEIEVVLATRPVNVLKLRTIMQAHPGLAFETELRIRVWRLLLLGEGGEGDEDLEDDLGTPESFCEEQQVLENDVRRTRAELEAFRTVPFRQAMQDILQHFCLMHNIQYKQGMNEVLAPFMWMLPPPRGTSLPYALFEAFLFRYLERLFCLDESLFLFKSFKLFHLLLLYHDPQLALHLNERHFPPELYSSPWFLTLFARSMPMPHLFRLWDQVIAVDDPAFTFFIGLCLLRKRRTELLSCEAEEIPDIIGTSRLQFDDGEDVDRVIEEALILYRTTPRSICRNLRLCCVATTDLAPLPSAQRQRADQANGNMAVVDHDLSMFTQAVRSCFLTTPNELVSFLLPDETGGDSCCVGIGSGSGVTGSGVRGSQKVKDRFVIIDVRGLEESITKSGGGAIPRAIQLEPDFLLQPDAFHRWLEHFDGMRGCSVCIIDLGPQGKALGGVSLWRRLLLGEGDGFAAASPPAKQTVTSSTLSISPLNNTNMAKGKKKSDAKSPYLDEETAAKADDEQRPAVKLARILQQDSFAKVSILEGGFPALVKQLNFTRGGVEPAIIGHDSAKWEAFLKATGRETDEASQRGLRKQAPATAAAAAYVATRRANDLSFAEKLSVALTVAQRSGHFTMAKAIENKIAALEVQQQLAEENSSIVLESRL